jgi:hypothetical protein
MVDTLFAAAALAAATNASADGAIAPVTPSQDSLSGETRTVVPTERRRIARATSPANDLASLKPLIQRAKVSSTLSETKTLLDQAERELRTGNHEQAMLTLDGAGLQLERVRSDMKGNTNFVETFIELERRESTLREKLGEPKVIPLRPAPLKKDAGQPAPAEEKKTDEEAPAKQVPDELPVG